MSLRNKILAFKDSRVETVEVPEWNDSVYIRAWTAEERAEMLAWHQQNQASPEKYYREFFGRVCLLSLCDDQGNRLFTQDDLPLLLAKSAKAIDRIAQAAMKLNGLAPESVEEAKANFTKTQS